MSRTLCNRISSFLQKAVRVALLVVFANVIAAAQQTVFNVPSADVMDKGSTYIEWDAVVGDSVPSLAFSPRTVRGLGHGIETGFNVTSFNLPTAGSVALVSTLKWKFFENTRKGIVLFGGEHLYTPLTQRSYTLGSYSYLAVAKSFRTGTRVSVGAYDFSAHVIDSANRGGIQASLEQTLSKRSTFATDWFSGNTSAGYVTSGFGYKLTPAISLLAGMQMGNSDLLQGNHSLLIVLGWTPSFKTNKN